MRRLVFVLLIVALALFAYYRNLPPRNPQTFTPATASVVDAKSVPALAALDAEYTALVQSVVPSVVSVATARRVLVPLVDSFDYFFGWRGRTTERTQPAGLGSGVIVSKEGHIITNHHVIAGSQQVQVQLTDGRQFAATVIGSDQNVDIAILQIKANDVVPLLLGDSDQVKVGQNVLAVGNPFGLQETVTRGIISAKGRALRDSGVEFFQTDAAVNPGNSGGPLLNLRGEIVGINSAIYSQTGSWAGISFAIPSNVAKRTLESILKTGHPVRGFLGAHIMALTPSLARQLGLGDSRGALVTDVTAGSPAEAAGLKAGDVIRSFNGKPIVDAAAYRDAIAAAGIGTVVKLGVIREGRDITITTKVTEMPDTGGEMANAQGAPGQGGGPARPRAKARQNVLAGIEVGEIPATLREAVPANVQGVVVMQLQPDSPAAEKLRVNDIIEEVNQRPVRTPDAFEEAAQGLGPTDRALLFVCRGKARSFVVITPAE